MSLKYKIAYAVLLILDLTIIPIVGFIQGFDTPATFIAVLCTVLFGHPLIYFILLLIKVFKSIEEINTHYFPLAMGLSIILGCLIWYLFYHVDFVYTSTISLWYGSVLLALSIPILIAKIVDKVMSKKKPDNGPKFIKNK